MMNLELHVLASWNDVHLAEKAGIIAFDDEVIERCENCDAIVGPRDEEFIPCVVVFEDNDEDDMYYLVCFSCSKPVVDPGLE